MDDVLKHALVLADPEAFFSQKAPAPTPAPRFETEEKAELGEDEDRANRLAQSFQTFLKDPL